MTYDDDLYGYAEVLRTPPDHDQLMRDLRAERSERGLMIGLVLGTLMWAAGVVGLALLGAF